MNEKIIWYFFLGKGMTAAGTAGLMGNLFAESGLIPTNLQNTFEKSLGMSDEEYTKTVDSGEYENFVHDSAGYGLAQWTFWSRKRNLLDFVQIRGKSVGDLETQLDFLWKELGENFSSVKKILCETDSVKSASNAVLLDFERPADQSEAMQERRYGYALNYYNLYGKQEEEKTMVKICLDAGHSGYTYNTGGWGYYESAKMWDLHLMLKADLEAFGMEVVTTRNTITEDPELYNRGATSKGCDMFLSLHSNACGTASVDYPVAICPYDGQNRSEVFGLGLAKNIADVMGTVQEGKTSTKTYNGGEYYGVMRGARAVGCPLYYIVEHSFHTNENASKWLLDHDNLKKLSALIAHEVAEWFGIDTRIQGLEEEEVAVGEVEIDPEIDYNDPSTWAESAWIWAKEQGLTDGTSPKGAMTREMFAVMLKQYHEKVSCV